MFWIFSYNIYFEKKRSRRNYNKITWKNCLTKSYENKLIARTIFFKVCFKFLYKIFLFFETHNGENVKKWKMEKMLKNKNKKFKNG